jgi:hypothetical protein
LDSRSTLWQLNPDLASKLERDFANVSRFGQIEDDMTAEQGALNVLANAAEHHIIVGEDDFEWDWRVSTMYVYGHRHLEWGRRNSARMLERMREVIGQV